MKIYKGICRTEYPKWRGWNHIALYESITSDFDTDRELQRSVRLHYAGIAIYKTIFNLSVYVVFYIVFNLIKG